MKLPLIFAACLILTAASPAAQIDNAADDLWKSFLENYREFSYKPLTPAELDKQARETLVNVSGARFGTWKPDGYGTFPEMVAEMSASDASVTQFGRIERTLEALLPKIDKYGSYHYAADIAQLIEAQKQGGGSVHMTLDNAKAGEVRCFPFEGGPSDLAGIGNGAQLLEVDGRDVKGKSLPALRLAFVGPPETDIRLKVRQPHGKIEEFLVTRTGKRFPNVLLTRSPLGVTLQIRKFSGGTASEVKSLMAADPEPKRFTLDLRGNPGGRRDEALKVASLFFPKGTVLAQFTTKEGAQNASDGNDTLLAPKSIRILQDERTASAAEYLVAVLKEGLPDITTVFGTKSFGKSHSTAQVQISGGGQLAVTEALLATGSGNSWDTTGILPDE